MFIKINKSSLIPMTNPRPAHFLLLLGLLGLVPLLEAQLALPAEEDHEVDHRGGGEGGGGSSGWSGGGDGVGGGEG